MMAAFRAFHSQGIAAIPAEVHKVGVFKLAAWTFHGAHFDIFGRICTLKIRPERLNQGLNPIFLWQMVFPVCNGRDKWRKGKEEKVPDKLY